MKKNTVMIFLALLLITSCSNSNNSGNLKLEKELYKGTSGIVVDMYQNNFPDEVYEGETLGYVLKLTNKGPYPVEHAKLILSVDKGYMQFDNNDNIKEITDIKIGGKTIFNTLDEFNIVEQAIKVNELDALSEYHDSVILSLLCYDYKGIAIADVCIDTDPYGVSTQTKACKVIDSIGLSGGQGGPVVITSVDTRMLIDNDFVRPQFKIHISNQGHGTVIKPGSLSSVCNLNSLTRDIYNSIILTNIKFSRFTMNDFECLPPELVLRKEEDSITCTLKSGLIRKTQNAYTTPLEIEISYGFMQSSSKEIKIKKILKY